MNMSFIDEIGKLLASSVLVEENVEPEVAAWRLEVCQGCEKIDKKAQRCKVCKCYLEVKTGSRINNNPKRFRQEITHCPLGKWGDLEVANEYRKIDGLSPLLSQHSNKFFLCYAKFSYQAKTPTTF